MQNEIENIMERITERLSSSASDCLRKIVLYGSYARGDYTENSDIDILVLVDASNPCSIYPVIKSEVDSLSDDYLIMISCHFQNYTHFYNAIDFTSFYKTVEKEGIVYYEHACGN
jgi:predicted nucleotidyltransferase